VPVGASRKEIDAERPALLAWRTARVVHIDGAGIDARNDRVAILVGEITFLQGREPALDECLDVLAGDRSALMCVLRRAAAASA
jgi:hypothetical protein